jgi:hypothetical protein
MSISGVESGERALVLMTNSGQRCEISSYTFQNVATEEMIGMKIIQNGARRSGFSIGQPAMVALDPGTYKIVSGNCMNRQYQPLTYRGIENWFEPFEVKGGDVRFLGNLQVSAAKGAGRQGLANAAIGRLFNLGLSTNTPNDYLVLKAVDAPTGAKSTLRARHPDLVDDFESAPLESRIDAKAFKKVVSDAYSLDDDGKEPLKSDAHKIVKAYLATFE